MAIAYGTQTSLLLYKESSSYGTVDAADRSTSVKQIFVSQSLKIAQQSLDSATINSSRERAKPALSNINVSGSIATELAPENCVTLFAMAVDPQPTKTGSSAQYTYTFTTGKQLAAFTAEVDFGANATPASPILDNRYHRFSGCKINNMTLQIPNSGFVTVNYDIIGKDVAIADEPYDLAPYIPDEFNPFSAFECTVFYGDASAANPTDALNIVESASLTINNMLDESVYSISNKGLRADLPNGFQTVTGQFSLLLDNATAPIILDKINKKADVSLKITLSRTSRTITFLMPRAVLEKTSPEISGPGGIKLSLTFKAFVDNPDTQSALQITAQTAQNAVFT
jgi:hypothetical protein